MSLADLAAIVVLTGLIAYTLFAGADFGGGVWTALAGGPRAERQREALFRAIGPVWEANHVWLILVIVTLFTVFPSAFADLFIALLVPLVIALVGIVFRGAAFAFRHFIMGTGTGLPATETVFSVASFVAPLSMGMAIGVIAGGHITIENGVVTSGLFETWLRPFPIICGLMTVTTCAVLAAFYMTTRTTGDLREDFRVHGLAASLMLGVLTSAAIPVAYWWSEPLWDGLLEPGALVLMGGAVTLGIGSLAVLWYRRFGLAPPIAAGAVTLVISAWAVAQYPYLIVPSGRVSDVAAESGTIALFLIVLAVEASLLIPSLLLLYRTLGTGETRAPGI